MVRSKYPARLFGTSSDSFLVLDLRAVEDRGEELPTWSTDLVGVVYPFREKKI